MLSEARNTARSKEHNDRRITFEHYAKHQDGKCAGCGKELDLTQRGCGMLAISDDAKALRARYRNYGGARMCNVLRRFNFPLGFELRCSTCVNRPKVDPNDPLIQRLKSTTARSE